jgi:dTMP kinase
MSDHARRGCFISIEGTEGVGKSTQIKALTDALSGRGQEYILTREPGGTEVGEAIRALLLSTELPAMDHRTELLLMFAARAEHIQAKILPALEAGTWVITDRFTDASFAYQGGGRQLPMEKISGLESWLQEGFGPDFTLLLDAPVEVGLDRAQKRGAQDRIEQEAVDFFSRVRQVYLDRAAADPDRFRIIDASQDEASVTRDVMMAFDDIARAWGQE